MASGIRSSVQKFEGDDDGSEEGGVLTPPLNLVSLKPGADLSLGDQHPGPLVSPAARPRVVHVLEAVAGGTLRHILDVLETVTTVEHHVVVPPDRAGHSEGPSVNALGTQQMLDSGAVLHRIPMLRNPAHPKNMAGLFHLRKLITNLKPIVVHGHSSVGGAFARAAVWGTKIPVIYTANGLNNNGAVLAVEKLLARRTNRFVAVSASEGQRALSLGLTSTDTLVVIPNGIDLRPPEPDRFNLRKELELHADVPLVGTVSRLVHQKAPVDFVHICAAVARVQPDVHFVLIGAGQLQPDVDAAVGAAGIEGRFHQIPFLPKAALAIQQLDVFVLPSLFEGAAYTPLEAMKAGVPVVLSDVTGNTNTIEHNVSGMLLPFGDIDAMSEAVLTLLRDESVRESLVAGASQRVRDHFDRDAMGSSLQTLYQDFSLKNS